MGKAERAESQSREEEYAINEGGTHNGNDYSTRGDVILPNGTEVELKYLKSGKGTLGNITQDAFTIYDIFDCLSWSVQRKESGYNEQRKDILKIYNPKVSDKDGTSIVNSIKDIKDEDKEKIINLANKNKIEYIKLLSKSNYNKEKLAKFVMLMIGGFHTIKMIKANMDKSIDDIKNIATDKYKIVYIYPDGNKEEDIKKIMDIFEDIDKFNIDFKECKQQNIVIRYDKIPILQVVFHWKNKFQGIKTPCLNVFLVE